MPSIDKDRPGMLSDICKFIFFMISIYAVDSINVFIIIIIVKLFIYLFASFKFSLQTWICMASKKFYVAF